MSIYLSLTQQFNKGKLRSIISSGQAVVLHRLAIMSKDGDWILTEDSESMQHILKVLSQYHAHYRFGAPLDTRWMAGGWSSHFEFQYEDIRVRTDFVTRPPRLHEDSLRKLWTDSRSQETPFVNLTDLAELKKTNREKDYAVIGELARQMEDQNDQLLYSRSAKDLIALAENDPKMVEALIIKRPVLGKIKEGRGKLEAALDAERRDLMHANEERLRKYINAAGEWAKTWPDVEKRISNLPILEAHGIITEKAEKALPFKPEG